ncbi:FG-GAP repeat-containing protein [Dyadobacter sp. SG02]|uniref:FG-GAP-like repeat-containing protein n=1 Tax=Dyadobacter sp. SG02 TaxID=1855291 RepID=UPI0008B8B6DF|nr:FG-GAP-like repeat-containing protein [Dyadobacter sp. SG02]SEI66352.1 FG-GAP repeat-containing protein [Dyadobacter sp. SG02]
MKQHILPLSIAASILLLFTYAFYACFSPASFHPAANGNPQKAARHTASDVPAGLAESIAAREYHISYDRARKILQSPNRRHNLRAYYRPGNLIIRNRIDSADHNFSLVLKNEGILADGRLLDHPDPAAKPEILENRLLIRHSKFTEEFINNEAGVRQNFIIQQAPEGTKELKVQLAAQGLRIRNGAENELLFFNKNDQTNPRLIYRDLQCWDARNQPLAAQLTATGQQIQITVDVRNAAYPVTIDPIVVNGSPVNANALLEADQADAWLGFSVASAGDVNADGYSDVLAGAPHYDNGQDGEGAAFLYYGSPNGLNPVPTVLESNQSHAELGYSVASAGDINADGFSDIALGAPFYDKGQANEGVVFVYFGSPKGVKPNPAVVLEGNQSEAHFGISVALAGDINGDNYSDLMVGASEFDQGQLNEGAAFVYAGSTNGIDPNKVTVLEMNQSISGMGTSVAGAGDVNADGFSDVLVGAPFYDLGEANEGAALVYLGSVKGISLIPTILQSDQSDAHLGASLASAGDLNGDGFSDIIVGAPHYDKAFADQGLVKIHLGSPNGINANASITLAGQQMNEEFGRTVACAGDVEGDGYADIMIASKMQGKNLFNEGVVKLFSGVQAGINKKPLSIFRGGQANAYLGQSLASAGDIDGDGFSDIVIGAHLYDHGQNNEGAVMVWHGGASGPDTAKAAALHSSQPESAFGYAVSGAGDIDGDGYDEIIVGAPHYDNGQAEEGVIFVFPGTPSGISKTASVMLEADQPDANFGASVSAAGDINGDGFGDIIAGAMHYDNGQDEEGAAFIYLGSASGINIDPIQLESNKSGAWFGCAVAHAGDLNDDGFSEIVIGAMNYSNGQSEEGALYLFPGSVNGPDLAGMRIIESDQEDARLGNAVSPAGDLNGDGLDDIVAGAYGLGDYDAGAIFIGYGKAQSLDSLDMEWIKGIQDQAHFGWDVSGAGDINGDGFHDLIVGANAYDNGDGAASIYYGAPTGITQANVTYLYAHETGMAAAMGESVAGAGDLDGDGYSDVLVGEPWFMDENTSIMTGLALVYYGSPAGIDPSPQRITGNPNDTFDFFGWSVAAAGDVNADGYSDMIVGSPNFSSGQTDADAAFVYYGNNGRGLRNNIRLYNPDLVTPLNYQQHGKSDFGIGLHSRSFLGKNKGKLVWETIGNGQSFSTASNGLFANSVSFNGSQKGFQILTGSELKSKVNKQGISTNLRVRIKYNPALALTGQMYGPWRYLIGILTGTTCTPVPIHAGSEDKAVAEAAYVYPNPAATVLHVDKGKLTIVGSVLMTREGVPLRTWKGSSDKLDLRGIRPGSYILRVRYADAHESTHSVVLN